MTTYEAGQYGGGKAITCILNEGDIGVSSGVHIPRGVMGYSVVTLAGELDKGDFVSLDLDANNTYANTNGIPVVVSASVNGLWGIVKTEPVWYGTFPQNARTESSAWDTILTNEEYRIATIEFFGITAIMLSNIEGTTDVEVGAPVAWDLSLDAFKDNADVVTGAWSMHHNADASNVPALIAISHLGVASGNADSGGIDCVA